MPAIEPLVVPGTALAKHFKAIEAILSAQVDTAVPAKVAADWSISPLVAGLAGEGCEFTERNRGPEVPVAPLRLLDGGLWAWLGYREEWDSEKPAGQMQRFSFRSAGLTVHFGYKTVRHKPQMFRAEWAGWARWSGGDGYSHQAGSAGHPHWQFDALESLKRDDAAERARIFLSVLRSEEAEVEPRDFSPQFISRDEVSELIGAQELSRLHFASAAAWWKAGTHAAHVHAPSSVGDLQIWVRETLLYTLRELERLQRL